ncbi:YhfG family protein [Candidatus Pantoea persica]|uniref:YhfG family protein n=1 Tax=Candidatus Pantoea persica TaxID=2518128 RepID=UPI00215DAED6|nr:YhfG family protein [Candidatus Pantoea persica]MBA2817540.1 DUF2559 domain-containing protein [Candidatus Pantoea persica]
MASKLTEKQKNTLWQQRHVASYQASCRQEGLTLAKPASTYEQAEARLESLRRQYGAE